VHVIAAKAVAFREALSDSFKEYQRQVVRNARTLADQLMQKGFDIVSGGTDNHLMLVDLTKGEVTGKEAEEALDRAGITVNKNAIPYDPRPPAVTSGIRLGSPCVTTRGMAEAEMTEIAALIAEVLERRNSVQDLDRLAGRVRSLCHAFPVY
jgi:glycine hydroxymethyltransferase